MRLLRQDLDPSIKGDKLMSVNREKEAFSLNSDTGVALDIHSLLTGRIVLVPIHGDFRNLIVELWFENRAGIVVTDYFKSGETSGIESQSSISDPGFWSQRKKFNRVSFHAPNNPGHFLEHILPLE